MIKTDIRWPKSIAQARNLQELHRTRVQIVSLEKEPEYIAGVDAAFSDDKVFAAACLFHYPDLTFIGQATAVLKAAFPYVPGYLLFREGPAIIAAMMKLKRGPDLILVDGHGIAHPRGIGSASHLGVLLDIPAIGCAKTKLVGEFEEPEKQKGKWSRLELNGRMVGVVLRTRERVRPLLLSPGHKVDLNDVIRITLQSTGKFRIPEPLRCADMLSHQMKKGISG